MAFTNLGRKIYNTSVDLMARKVLKKKRKDLLRLMEREPDTIAQRLMDIAYRTGNANFYEANKTGFSVAANYDKARHYFIDDDIHFVPINKNEKLTGALIRELEDVFTVEFNMNDDIVAFVQIINLERTPGDDIFIDDEKCVCSMNIFMWKEGSGIPMQYPIFYGYLAEGWDTAYMVVNELHPFSRFIRKASANFRMGKKSMSCKVAADSTDDRSFTQSVLALMMMNLHLICQERGIELGEDESADLKLVNMLETFVKQVEEEERAKTKGKKTSSPKVPKKEDIPEVLHIVVEDKLVPLRKYIKEYEPSMRRISKGGHHASPIEHDRRGFYRKSRGRGDYELVNGEFVYVGNKEGHYSYVPATHVKGNGKKPTLIYKV